jgi:hypothetical protein
MVVCCSLQDIRDISARIATAVIETAAAEGHVGEEAAQRLAGGTGKLLEWVKRSMFDPRYASLAYLPLGTGE